MIKSCRYSDYKTNDFKYNSTFEIYSNIDFEVKKIKINQIY